MRDNRTGGQRRADNRAAVAGVVDSALVRCDRSARALWAARLDVSSQHIDEVVAGRKALHVCVLAEAPLPVALDVAQHIIGPTRCVVDLPESIETPDDLSLLARLVRESNATVEALITVAADGRITADEGKRLADAARRSLAVTAAVEALGKRAVALRVVQLRAVAR